MPPTERVPHRNQRNQRKPLNWWRLSVAIESVVIDAPGMYDDVSASSSVTFRD